MSFRVPNQPNRAGDERARELFFGGDSACTTPPGDLGPSLAAVASDGSRALLQTAERMRNQAAGVEHRESLGPALSALAGASTRLIAAEQHLALQDVQRPFRVVLMGRTMAGKSTLFEFLSAGDGARVGAGAQRTTRESCSRVAVDLDIDVVDTPGVGAMDGDEDYETAFREVADADLILWVATDQATQEQTGRALERLSDLGKPIVVALNCLADVSDELGLYDMLEEPERVFGGDAEGNLAPIRRHLAQAGGRYISAVPIHAQAALVSLSDSLGDEDANVLRHNSQIDSLIDTLREQRDRTAGQRRIVSTFDFLRVELLDAASVLSDAIAETRATVEASVGSQRDFRKRALRRVEDAHEEIKAATASALTSRERWIEHVDVDQAVKKINEQWNVEMSALRAELEQAISDVGDRLEADLKEIAVDVADDWAEFELVGFRGIGGRGEIWANRAVKVGGRVAAGIGGLAGGAKVGAIVGGFFGPGIGNAVGLGVGAIVGLVGGILGVNRAIDWLGDKLFRSASEVRERRRRKVSDQLTPILIKLKENLESGAARVRHDWLEAIEVDYSSQAAACRAIGRALAELARASSDLDTMIAQVDADLSRELLRTVGRGRAAAAMARATRWRGAGIAVDLPEPEFSELVLFPATSIVLRIVPTSRTATPSANALQILRCLADRPMTVRTMDHDSLSVELAAPLPPGVQAAWEALAQVHSGIRVQINRTESKGVRNGSGSRP